MSVESISQIDLFALEQDETIELKAGDLQEFLRLIATGYPNPGLSLERNPQSRDRELLAEYQAELVSICRELGLEPNTGVSDPGYFGDMASEAIEELKLSAAASREAQEAYGTMLCQRLAQEHPEFDYVLKPLDNALQLSKIEPFREDVVEKVEKFRDNVKAAENWHYSVYSPELHVFALASEGWMQVYLGVNETDLANAVQDASQYSDFDEVIDCPSVELFQSDYMLQADLATLVFRDPQNWVKGTDLTDKVFDYADAVAEAREWVVDGRASQDDVHRALKEVYGKEFWHSEDKWNPSPSMRMSALMAQVGVTNEVDADGKPLTPVKAFAERLEEVYGEIYDGEANGMLQGETWHELYNEAVSGFDQFIADHSDFVADVAHERGENPITSDRECAAFMFAYAEKYAPLNGIEGVDWTPMTYEKALDSAMHGAVGEWVHSFADSQENVYEFFGEPITAQEAREIFADQFLDDESWTISDYGIPTKETLNSEYAGWREEHFNDGVMSMLDEDGKAAGKVANFKATCNRVSGESEHVASTRVPEEERGDDAPAKPKSEDEHGD